MFKYLMILALGVLLGYGYGWRDAQKNERHLAERVLDGIGGQSRKFVASDVDSQMRASEKQP